MSKQQQRNPETDSSEFNEAIDYFRESILQIKNQMKVQQLVFDKLHQKNEEMSTIIDQFSRYVDDVLNQNDIKDEEEDFNEDIGTFDMASQVVIFKGKKYAYNKESLFCGQQKLKRALEILNDLERNNIYPQSVEYCKRIVNQQIKKDGSVIILSNKSSSHSTFFFFVFNEIPDLSPSQGLIYDTENDIRSEISKLYTDFSKDKFPQGKEYCRSLLEEQLKENSAVNILMRSNGDIWTRYYFKTNRIKAIPKENFHIFSSEEDLVKQLKFIEASKAKFYNGAEYCKKVVQDELENNGQIFVIVDKKNDTYYYYHISEISNACDKEWWCQPIPKNISKFSGQKHRPQGEDYFKNYIKEKKKSGELMHVLVRHADNLLWFYF